MTPYRNVAHRLMGIEMTCQLLCDRCVERIRASGFTVFKPTKQTDIPCTHQFADLAEQAMNGLEP